MRWAALAPCGEQIRGAPCFGTEGVAGAYVGSGEAGGVLGKELLRVAEHKLCQAQEIPWAENSQTLGEEQGEAARGGWALAAPTRGCRSLAFAPG